MSDDTTTPTPTPTPAPTAAPTATPVATAGNIPRARLNDEISKRNEAASTRDAALARVAELEASLAQATSQLTNVQSTNAQEMHLMGLGFKAESVRRFFRREYQAAAAEAGERAPTFDAWLDASKADPLYAVHFDRVTPKTEAPLPTGQAPEPTQQQKLIASLTAALTGNPDAGTSQPPTGQAREWTVEDVRRERAKNGGRLGATRQAMIDQLRAQGKIR